MDLASPAVSGTSVYANGLINISYYIIIGMQDVFITNSDKQNTFMEYVSATVTLCRKLTATLRPWLWCWVQAAWSLLPRELHPLLHCSFLGLPWWNPIARLLYAPLEERGLRPGCRLQRILHGPREQKLQNCSRNRLHGTPSNLLPTTGYTYKTPRYTK